MNMLTSLTPQSTNINLAELLCMLDKQKAAITTVLLKIDTMIKKSDGSNLMTPMFSLST